jgi:acetylornithine deacetylase
MLVHETQRNNPWLSKHPPTVSPRAAGFGSSQIPENHPLVTALSEATENVFERRPKTVGAPYGCDMSGWIRLAGVPTVIYGPGDITQAHAANEYASLSLTNRCARALPRATEELLETSAAEMKLPAAEPSPEGESDSDSGAL